MTHYHRCLYQYTYPQIGMSLRWTPSPFQVCLHSLVLYCSHVVGIVHSLFIESGGILHPPRVLLWCFFSCQPQYNGRTNISRKYFIILCFCVFFVFFLCSKRENKYLRAVHVFYLFVLKCVRKWYPSRKNYCELCNMYIYVTTVNLAMALVLWKS